MAVSLSEFRNGKPWMVWQNRIFLWKALCQQVQEGTTHGCPVCVHSFHFQNLVKWLALQCLLQLNVKDFFLWALGPRRKASRLHLARVHPAQTTDPTLLPRLLELGFRLNTIVHLWEIHTVELTASLLKYSPVLQVGGQFWQEQTCQDKEGFGPMSYTGPYLYIPPEFPTDSTAPGWPRKCKQRRAWHWAPCQHVAPTVNVIN